MSTKMLVTARLDQRMAMSQQLKQAIALLQYNSLELQQVIMQYLESNPLLEVDEIEPSGVLDKQGNTYDAPKHTADFSKPVFYSEMENTLENYPEQKSLRHFLLEQTLLCGFDPSHQVIAEAIIDTIDDNGYLTMLPEDIYLTLQNRNELSIDDIKATLAVIQTFEPAGIASINMHDCLLTQLDNIKEKNAAWYVAQKIVSECFDSMNSANTKQILKKLKISHEEYIEAITLIRTLHPHPGLQYSMEENIHIEPELYVKKIKNEWQVFLTDSLLTHLKINKQYQSLISQNRKNTSYASLKRELEEAQWLVSGLKRRNETLLNVATMIMKYQKDFLEHGQEFMKPMNIADISTQLSLHESTVSRVTTEKYIATPRGVFELKYFFPSHVAMQTGKTCSATAVKAFIKEIISHETSDHIYSDNEIVELLHQKGINIARRTVAKYRESLHILSSYERQIRLSDTTV